MKNRLAFSLVFLKREGASDYSVAKKSKHANNANNNSDANTVVEN